MTFRRFTKIFSGRVHGRVEIDPDEIFLDSHNLPDFDVHQFEGRIEKPISKGVVQSVGAVFLLVGCIFLGKLWTLQVKQGQAFELRSQSNHLQHTTIFADRGVIYDRNKTELAWNDLNPNGDFALRKYIDLSGFAHLVGYVKYPQKDSSGVYYSDAFVGKDGVEDYYDKELTGKNGLKITETNVLGEVQSESTLTPPTDGADLLLSVDARVQNKLFEVIKSTALDREFTGGSGVIMDVHTGEMLALTNYPEYDQNILTDGTDSKAVNAILKQPGNPFLNRAISGLYIPGSIIKPFIAMGVLEENIIDPMKQILSTGSIAIPNPYNPSKPTIFRDWKVHGWVDMRKAIAVSSDEYFYAVGAGNAGQKGLGIEKIGEYVRLFGWGDITGINLHGEKAGTIPSPEWKEKMFDGEPWRIGDTFNSSIGQYGYQTTPIQAVRAVAVFGNGGTLVTPTVLLDDPMKNKKMLSLSLDPNHFQIVREGMRLAVTEGTAKGLDMNSLTIAAKTGTAELGITKDYVNSWVVGYFPYENPRYAFAVLMERGHKGNGIGATFVMRTLLDWMVVNTPEYTK